MPVKREPYSYNKDPALVDFPDDRPIIIFDGYCVLCSRWAQFVIRHDPQGKFRLLAAQSQLGYSLYKHYGLDPEDYESNILIAEGLAWFKSEGTIRMFEGLGLPWSVMRVFRILPVSFRDKLYSVLARNRFRLFGKRETCFVASPETKARFLS
ncbi:thiol-disulfide oxidoreductase DCC family protein [Gammaproteobacteria bacterium]|nr:thiol-disulfide oxidoreductase DCC family protein [Gammaproteobacteria bacterium]